MTLRTILLSTFFITQAHSAVVSGNLIVWQPLAVDFTGSFHIQSDTSPNPFRDFRLDVTFRHIQSGTTYKVPGYFDGNGIGGDRGQIWRTMFTPDRAGQWEYTAQFRSGNGIAVSTAAGQSIDFDGEQGLFTVAPLDSNAPGYLKYGRLEYNGTHYLKFRDGPAYIKTGTDGPENFLAYTGFVNTPNAAHDYSTHVVDWSAGDPDWDNGKGKGIIGALNYLSSRGVNSIYFLPMNIGGDGRDTFPFILPQSRSGSTSNNNVNYDIPKLRQWETVFAHSQRKGIMLHFVLNEAEEANKKELDNAELGTERKLFYRELIARFGHHNAIVWNICEEYEYKYNLTVNRVKEFAGYIQNLDPYKHPITVHIQSNPDESWDDFVGDSRFSLTSFQYPNSNAGLGSEVERWRGITAAANRPIPIMMDELSPLSSSNMPRARKELLWPTLLSGGGIEYYLGSSDLTLDEFRKFDLVWTWSGYARKFAEDQLDVINMRPADTLLTGVSNRQVFVKTGTTSDIYALYLPTGTSSGVLNMSSSSGSFSLQWFNPRTGLFEGSARTLTASASVALGAPPSSASEDWVVLVKASGPVVPQNPPIPPDNLGYHLTPPTTARISWRDTSTNEEFFEIERALTHTGTFSVVGTVAANQQSFIDNGVQGGEGYSYRVSAVNSAGRGTTAAQPFFMPTILPPPPVFFINPPSSVTALTIMNTATDQVVGTLQEGQVIDLRTPGFSEFTLRAEVGGSVSKIQFNVDTTTNFRTESVAPYTLTGDTSGDYRPWAATTGAHTVSAVPFDSSGLAQTPLTVNFSVLR